MTWWAWAAVVVAVIVGAVGAFVVYLAYHDDGRGCAAGPHTPTAGRISSPWNVFDRYL